MVEDTVDDIRSVSSRVALTRKALNFAEGGEGEINSFFLPSYCLPATVGEEKRYFRILNYDVYKHRLGWKLFIVPDSLLSVGCWVLQGEAGTLSNA